MKYIDIEKVIHDSGSPFLKRLPRYVVRLIIWLIRQDEMNRILNKYSDRIGIPFLKCILDEFNINVDLVGLENLPDNPRSVFVSNHPFGIADGLVLTSIVAAKYGSFKAFGNDAFMLIPNLRPLIAEINVFGRNSKQQIVLIDEIYSSDTPITHFPAGEVSRVYHRKIQDCAWQKSFITKAVAKKRWVVPVYFEGRNSWLFYAVFIVRRLLGIKLNLELLLLPREMFRKRNKTIRVRIGTPIPYETFDESKSHTEWAQEVKSRVYALSGRH
jgi:putative hemolysin